VRIEPPCQPNLAAVVDAAHRERLFFAFGQGRQQQGGENGNDGDNHQQFDQGEAYPPGPYCHASTAHMCIATTTFDSVLLSFKMQQSASIIHAQPVQPTNRPVSQAGHGWD
jgi:hypothetical protein